MKKENREMAQKRKALERKRAAQKKKIKKIAAIAVPSVMILAVIILLIYFGWKDAHSSSGSEATEAVASTQVESTASLTETETEANTLNTTEGTVVNAGDTVNIDYVGKIDGEEFDGGSTDGAGTDLTLGSGSYISGFEDQLEGHAVGDTVEVNVTFPDDYSATDLAGKAATFTVTINGVYQ